MRKTIVQIQVIALLWTLQVPTLKAAPDDAASLYRRLTHNSPESSQVLNIDQLHGLWRQALHHKVAGLDDPAKLDRYDPTGVIGFCFGRALAVHLMARRLGLAEGSIAKLFIVGDLRSAEDPEWRFHVTTLARGPQDRWYAVDPILEGPLPVEDWISSVQRTWDKGKKARLYLTPASAVIPDLRSVPNLAQEKGEHLIELSFDPARHPDLARSTSLGPPIYAVSPEAARRYFSSADSRPSFDFDGIAINGSPIGFNNYFTDLMREIDTPETPLILSMGPKRAPAQGAVARPLGLRVDLLGSAGKPDAR